MPVQIRSVPPLRTIPAGWTVNPSQCEFLGTDEHGAEYWCITVETIAPGVAVREVVKHQSGATRWLCSYHSWPLFCRINPVTLKGQ